jgi:hypothetical protein
MNKYQHRKIYKIWSPNTEHIYIGSTTESTLAKQMAKHRAEWYSAHKPEAKQQSLRWKEANKEKVQQYKIDHYVKNKEVIAQRSLEHYI